MTTADTSTARTRRAKREAAILAVTAAAALTGTPYLASGPTGNGALGADREALEFHPTVFSETSLAERLLTNDAENVDRNLHWTESGRWIHMEVEEVTTQDMTMTARQDNPELTCEFGLRDQVLEHADGDPVTLSGMTRSAATPDGLAILTMQSCSVKETTN